MAVTRDQVLAALYPDEPDYEEAARRLGPDAIPFLLELVEGDDLALASKAASLAGSLGTNRSAEVLAAAARSPEPLLHVAAAAALRNVPDIPVDLAETLLDDPEPGVRKWALRSLEAARPAGLKGRVRAMAASDPEATLRDLAQRIEPELPDDRASPGTGPSDATA
jgi:HEAT repeat protein